MRAGERRAALVVNVLALRTLRNLRRCWTSRVSIWMGGTLVADSIARVL